MRPPLNDETDDDYFDDLIKLFDSEHDRVHFGSQATQDNGLFKSTMILSKLNHSTENVTLEKDAEPTGIEDSDSKNFNERDCRSLYIKLVDCSKFPWYYKKYTQQILEKVNICVSVSDSDSEIDMSIERNDDLSDDCFIIDDIFKETNNQNNKHSVSSLPPKTSESTARKNCREDIELQKALSRKQSGTVDFKRNKGLIGMKITQKYVKEINLTTAEPNLNKTTVTKVTENQIIAKSNINASGKALNSIGTICIAPTVPKVPKASKESEAKNYKSVGQQESMANMLIDKIPVKFSLGKISEKLVEQIITKNQDIKCQYKLPDNKTCKDFNEKKTDSDFLPSLNPSSSLSKVENSSRTVKNIKNTTKYKKQRLKDFDRKLLELVTLESNKKETLPYEANNVDENTNKGENLRRSLEKEYEPDSPILLCSKLVKENININESVKAFEHSSKIGKRYTSKEKKLTSQSDTIHQVSNKPMSGNCNNSGTLPRTPVESTIKSKKLNSEIKHIDGRDEATKSLKEVPLKCDVVVKSYASITNTQSCSSSHTDTVQTSFPMSSNGYNNLTMNPIVSHNPIPFCFTHSTTMTSYVPNGNSMNYSKNISDNIISSSNEVASNQCTNINNEITSSSTTTVLSTQCKPTSTANIYDKYTYNVSKQNDGSNKTILSHLNNGPSHNFYASAIVLKPTQPKSISCGPQFNHPIPNTQGSSQIPRMQPRFYLNPYKTNHYRPPYNQEQRFIPRTTNCTMTNNRFPAPYNNRCNFSYNSPPFSSSPTGWRMPNNFYKWDPRSERPLNYFPPHLPISELQTNANPTMKTKLELVSQLDKIAKPMINTQHHSSRVLNTNEDTPKIKNQDPRYSTRSYKEDINILNTQNVSSEQNYNLVTSKTKMLELLDSETNNLKITVNKDDTEIEKKLDDLFKTPDISSKPEMTINKDYRKDMDRQNGYSPPILPIPTFERLLDRVKINVQNESKKIRYVKESNKKTIGYQSPKNVRKRDIKTNKEITHMNDFYNSVVSGKFKESIRKQEIKKYL